MSLKTNSDNNHGDDRVDRENDRNKYMDRKHYQKAHTPMKIIRNAFNSSEVVT